LEDGKLKALFSNLFLVAILRSVVEALFRKIDCYSLPVPDLDSAQEFYRKSLGHELAWRTAKAAGLRLPNGDGELVLQAERPGQETDLLVESVAEAVIRFVEAGGRVIREPFDIQVGKCAVVADPFGNVLVMLDMSKGRLVTDADGHVVGNEGPA
jgi:predicted enzyme related to lactoylglutathione lyase